MQVFIILLSVTLYKTLIKVQVRTLLQHVDTGLTRRLCHMLAELPPGMALGQDSLTWSSSGLSCFQDTETVLSLSRWGGYRHQLLFSSHSFLSTSGSYMMVET